MPSLKLAKLLRADLAKCLFVQLPIYAFLKCPVSPFGYENLLVIMYPASFDGFIFDLCPSLQPLLWSLILIILILIILIMPMAP